MARTTPIDKLAATLDSVLKEYNADVFKNLDEVVKKVSKSGATAIRAEARRLFNGTGEYAKGWTSIIDNTKRSVTGIIYNSKKPSLAHLLEFGHAKRGGGRTRAFPHIAPVENEIVEKFEKEVERLI